MNRFAVPNAAMFALGTLFIGCLESPSTPPDPARAEPAAIRAAANLNFTYIDFPGSVPAFTSYASVTGWALDKLSPAGLNSRVRRWNSGNDALVSGAFRDLDIIANTHLWAVDADGRVHKNTNPYAINGGTWTLVCSNCEASTIAAGANGSVYISSFLPGGEHTVRRYNPSNNTWTDLGFPLIRMDVDNNGDLYGIDKWGFLYRLKAAAGSSWEYLWLPFVVADLAAGGGRVYLLNSNDFLNGYGSRVHAWSAGGTTALNLYASNLQADAAGRCWATNGEHSLYRYTP